MGYFYAGRTSNLVPPSTRHKHFLARRVIALLRSATGGEEGSQCSGSTPSPVGRTAGREGGQFQEMVVNCLHSQAQYWTLVVGGGGGGYYYYYCGSRVV